MVLESIFDEKQVMRKPLMMLFLAILLSGTAILTSHLIFPSTESILGIAFITIGAIPIIHAAYLKEEAKEIRQNIGGTFLERHFSLIKIYSWFFIGLVISFAFWFIVLPSNPGEFCVLDGCFAQPCKTGIFEEQLKTLDGIENLRSRITGNVIAQPNCAEDFFCVFRLIFMNNTNVLIIAVLTSFVYGAGALFVISWNASVIGVLVGKSIIAEQHFRFLGLLPHGIPELMGYFIGAIAGGIVSAGITRKKHFKNEMRIVFKDALFLIFLALFSLLIGAAVEAYLISGDEIMGLTVAMFYIILIMTLIVGHSARHYREK